MSFSRFAFPATAFLAFASCSHSPPPSGPSAPDAPISSASTPVKGVGSKAEADLVDAQGRKLGRLTFTQGADGLAVEGRIPGLKARRAHGLHVHQGTVCEGPDFESAGDHFNPGGMAHGGPHSEVRHPGDFGNVKADRSGTAKLRLTVTDVSIAQGAAHSILGHAVILHAKADDLKSQPAGNSGARLACGLVRAVEP